MSVVTTSQKEQDCINSLQAYSFWQIRDEICLSSYKDFASCAYLEAHDSFWRTAESISCGWFSQDLGCILQSPAGAGSQNCHCQGDTQGTKDLWNNYCTLQYISWGREQEKNRKGLKGCQDASEILFFHPFVPQQGLTEWSELMLGP